MTCKYKTIIKLTSLFTNKYSINKLTVKIKKNDTLQLIKVKIIVMNTFKFQGISFFQTVKKDFKNNVPLSFFVLSLITIPLNHAVNSVFLVLFFIASSYSLTKKNFSMNKSLFYLVAFYLLMLLSLLWTSDQSATLQALIKEVPLLVIPLCFLLGKEFLVDNKIKILKYYSYSIIFVAFYFIVKATYNYLIINDLSVFFFHDLVTKDLNAVHFSVFVSIAFFYFWTKEMKTNKDNLSATFLAFFLFLLSSKNIFFTTVLLSIIHFFYFSKSANKMRLRNIIFLGFVLVCLFSFGWIKERLVFEFKIKEESNIGHTVINKQDVGSNVISMKEAWYNQKFNQTDYFSGSSFRVYQARLFFEFIKEDNIFWKGFGLNASYKKIEEKGLQNNVFQGNELIEGYQKKNFHNQYIQVFAELGVFGFILLILIMSINLKNAIKLKDFIHIAFAVLMISLFLTESFLWRQRGVVFFTLFYCLFNSKQSQ